MPRRRRACTAGLVFHVLNRAAKRAALFEEAADYEAFERVLRTALARSNVALFAYCLMPNHWHLVLAPVVDGAMSRFMHWLTTTHARRWQLARAMDGHGSVYQGRFKAVAVSSDRHFLWVCRYVERNPLRASLVQRAEEWPWSSLASRHSEYPEQWLAEWPVSRPGDWLAHVNSPQTDAELRAFRRAIVTSEPFGNQEWRQLAMARLGLEARRGRGQPRKYCPRTVLKK